MSITEEFATRNFISKGLVFYVSFFVSPLGYLISSMASSFVIIFVEIPLLMKICPTSSRFDDFMRQFTTNYMRAAIYLSMGLVQWLSLIGEPSSLLAAAILLTLAGTFYTLAGVKGQGFVGSKTLGGQGVAQMII
ncbi:Golgi apparatus membrane protein tvp18 [Golovinomyces cichoracearum]|uniref:Golgi apparatus membrane protein tvp18 n=1 Tax=Golovinomyces cichoracearum TaxID=62708 RepID=A0A420IQE7_9PEZI|nr:Golgi apparatus membrane protein tvp18 [Golovinomyces cichoracearum]